MGIGMVVIVGEQKATEILSFCKERKQKAWLIGEVVKGKGQVRVVV
jgi:phosphoribosylaminoimidazole (AIR) synthetase